jgi:hypothetical protein
MLLVLIIAIQAGYLKRVRYSWSEVLIMIPSFLLEVVPLAPISPERLPGRVAIVSAEVVQDIRNGGVAVDGEREHERTPLIRKRSRQTQWR